MSDQESGELSLEQQLEIAQLESKYYQGQLEESEKMRVALRDALFERRAVEGMQRGIIDTAEKILKRRFLGDLNDHRLGRLLKGQLATLKEAEKAPKEPKMVQKPKKKE